MNEPIPDLATLERLLKGVRQEVRNLQVMQMRPGQSAEKLAHLADLERSARAEVKLRHKAIVYDLSQQNSDGSPLRLGSGVMEPPMSWVKLRMSHAARMASKSPHEAN